MLKFNVYQLKQLVNLIANAKASIIQGVALVIFTIVALNFLGCVTSETQKNYVRTKNSTGFLIKTDAESTKNRAKSRGFYKYDKGWNQFFAVTSEN